MKNQVLKDNIYDEILVDCNGQGEENMSWFYAIARRNGISI